MKFYDVNTMEGPLWRCYRCLNANYHDLLEQARNRLADSATTGVQSQCTCRRAYPHGRFVADVQGFRRGGEVDEYHGEEFANRIDGVLRLRNR